MSRNHMLHFELLIFYWDTNSFNLTASLYINWLDNLGRLTSQVTKIVKKESFIFVPTCRRQLKLDSLTSISWCTIPDTGSLSKCTTTTKSKCTISSTKRWPISTSTRTCIWSTTTIWRLSATTWTGIPVRTTESGLSRTTTTSPESLPSAAWSSGLSRWVWWISRTASTTRPTLSPRSTLPSTVRTTRALWASWISRSWSSRSPW